MEQHLCAALQLHCDWALIVLDNGRKIWLYPPTRGLLHLKTRNTWKESMKSITQNLILNKQVNQIKQRVALPHFSHCCNWAQNQSQCVPWKEPAREISVYNCQKNTSFVLVSQINQQKTVVPNKKKDLKVLSLIA